MYIYLSVFLTKSSSSLWHMIMLELFMSCLMRECFCFTVCAFLCFCLCLCFCVCDFFGRIRSSSRGLRLAPFPLGRLSTAQCIQGNRRSTGISLWRSLWRPLAAAAEGADSSASRSVCLRRGVHPIGARRSRCVGWHPWPG